MTHTHSDDTETIGWDELHELCTAALRRAGADDAVADALAAAAVGAERRGKPSVGVGHLFDYVNALAAGRLNGAPGMGVTRPRASIVEVMADDGPAQLAYHLARDAFVETARETGIAMMGIHRSFTAGELGYFADDLAGRGLFAMIGSNSPPLMSVFGAKESVTGTNPFAFGIPSADGPRTVDQAASQVAWVRVREAADRGEAIPEGWAVDAEGAPTTDAAAALEGAMLPFGGMKGGNIAVFVEVLAALVGGRYSLDTPPFDRGSEPLRVGCWIVAIDPEAFGGGFVASADAHFARLGEFIGHEFGRRRAPLEAAEIPAEVLAKLRTAA